MAPGLLQTAEYARAVFDCLYPPITPQEAEDRMLDRLDRQADSKLGETSPVLTVSPAARSAFVGTTT
ncbi:Scr1 family TA system antitoxin-like transcriptional regulator [Streptomyces roseicoloratus]|uniref:Scr1 family TA system antitoxin-like transcriptional regulator n=1 Tax=Streptomyces roseicoloratus TaxID=2508722 RepID=UPI003CCC4DE3